MKLHRRFRSIGTKTQTSRKYDALGHWKPLPQGMEMWLSGRILAHHAQVPGHQTKQTRIVDTRDESRILSNNLI